MCAGIWLRQGPEPVERINYPCPWCALPVNFCQADTRRHKRQGSVNGAGMRPPAWPQTALRLRLRSIGCSRVTKLSNCAPGTTTPVAPRCSQNVRHNVTPLEVGQLARWGVVCHRKNIRVKDFHLATPPGTVEPSWPGGPPLSWPGGINLGHRPWILLGWSSADNPRMGARASVIKKQMGRRFTVARLATEQVLLSGHFPKQVLPRIKCQLAKDL
jgi:hypothetical protein